MSSMGGQYNRLPISGNFLPILRSSKGQTSLGKYAVGIKLRLSMEVSERFADPQSYRSNYCTVRSCVWQDGADRAMSIENTQE